MSEKIKKTGKFAIVLGIAFAMIGMYFLSPLARAATVTSRSDTLSDSRPSTASNHTIAFTLGDTVDVGDTLTITFASAFDTSTIVEDDVDIKDDTVDLTTAADCSGSEQASVAMAADVLTITPCSELTGGITSASVIEIQVGLNATASGTGTHQITNSTAATYDIDVGGTFGGTGKMQVAILSGVAVTATVSETLSFSLDDSTIGFGTWSTTELRYANAAATGGLSDPGAGEASTATLSTNADSATVTMHDTNDGLDSTTDTIATTACSTFSSGGSENYCIYMENDSNVTLNSNFDGVSCTGELSTTAQQVASVAAPVSNGTWDVRGKAAISATTDPGSYSDTLIFIATPTY